MVVDFTIEIEGGDKLVRSLELAARGIKDYQEFFEESLGIVEKSVDESFATSGASTGKGKWQSLATRTKIARQRRYGHYKNSPSSPNILRWTGKMQESKRKLITKVIGSLEYTDPRASYHQFGRGVPKRPFLVLNPKINAELTRSLLKHIDRVLGVANLR